MTRTALTSNKEWNTRVVSTEKGEVAQSILSEFNELWNSEYALEYNEFYEIYKEKYKIIKRQREIARSEELPSIEKYRLQPNSMKIGFIVNLKKIIEAGEERADAFERLAMEEQDATDETQPLDYIFSVEILNEGVDIVEVNQVIMLRPTESPIVFIQQLGRGLRKAEGKEYVVKTEIKVGDLIDTIEYDYPTFHLSMDCFWAEIVSGDLVLTEHEASRWLTKAELDSVECLQSVRN